MTDALTVVRSATSLRLPWPPSVNAYKMPIRRGRFVTMALTPRARAYRVEVADAIFLQTGRRSLVGYDTPVQIDIELRAPDRRARDIDNHVKMAIDGLVAAGILSDDKIVDVLVVRRGQLIRHGRAIVLIAPLDQQPDLVEQP